MVIRFVLLLLFLLAGCVSQSAHWGAWSDWGDWKDTGRVESRALRITSEPSGCEVYADGRFEGRTPLTVSFSYPVLESGRDRKKHLFTHSNWTLEWLILRNGDRPGSSQVVDSEKETRNMVKTVAHEIILKRDGFMPASKLASMDDSSAHFVLKEKLCLFFKNVKVVNESELSLPQKMYDAVFKQKYSKDVKPGWLKDVFESDARFKEVFTVSRSWRSCNVLDCELVIRSEYTDLSVTVLDGRGRDVLRTSSRFKTGFEREEFLSVLQKEIGEQAQKIYRALCQE